jgi:hypothetical protein
MKRIFKIFEENYPALVLITLWALYEYWLIHFSVNPIIRISNNAIEKPYLFDETVSERIHYCIMMSFLSIVIFHIPHFIIILIMRYIAKCSMPFNKKALKILCIITIISMIFLFFVRLYADLWLFRVI